MEIEAEYGRYKVTYESINLFCPYCGKKSLWRDHGPGDHYVGQEYLCISCRQIFYLPDSDFNQPVLSPHAGLDTIIKHIRTNA
jgi:DNA-directed RNA polymerase subunit RPC12/RpoP